MCPRRRGEKRKETIVRAQEKKAECARVTTRKVEKKSKLRCRGDPSPPSSPSGPNGKGREVGRERRREIFLNGSPRRKKKEGGTRGHRGLLRRANSSANVKVILSPMKYCITEDGGISWNTRVAFSDKPSTGGYTTCRVKCFFPPICQIRHCVATHPLSTFGGPCVWCGEECRVLLTSRQIEMPVYSIKRPSFSSMFWKLSDGTTYGVRRRLLSVARNVYPELARTVSSSAVEFHGFFRRRSF